MSLFAELGPAELEQIASWLNVEERESGTTLAQQGASGYAFYVLRHGTATVLQGDEEIRQLGPGDFFGELSIIGGPWRGADQPFCGAASRMSIHGMVSPGSR
jgi:ATP-binding cassette subfamily B protein